MLGLFPLVLLAGNMLACITNSRFTHVPAIRYLLPVYPGVMALCSMALSSTKTETGRWVCRGILVGIIACQVWLLPRAWHPDYRKGVKEYGQNVEQLIAFCRTQGIDALRADWFSHGLNFRTAEQLTVCTYPEYDRYRPYRAAAATATNVAVMNNFGNLDEFLRRMDAVSETTQIGRFQIKSHIIFQDHKWREIDSDNIFRIEKEDGTVLVALVDDDLDTPLGFGNIDREYPQTTPVVIRVEFTHPMMLAGLVAHGPSGSRQNVDKVVCRGPGNGMNTVYKREAHDVWFRSGPTCYPGGMLDCEEIVFPPILTKEAWLTVHAVPEGKPLVSELLFFEEVGDEKSLDEMVPEKLVEWLQSHHAGYVYAPRYLSEWLHANAPQFKTIIPDNYYDQYDGFDLHENRLLRMQDINENSVMIVPRATALRTARVLESRGYRYEVEDLDEYRLFYNIHNERSENPALNRCIYWTEHGCFLSDEAPGRLKDAAVHLEKAREYIEQRNNKAARSEAKLALELWPDLPQAYTLLTQLGQDTPIPKEIFLPTEEPLIRFENGIELVGFRINKKHINIGGSFPVEYVWRCPVGVDPQPLAVFVHFEQGNSRFQDDHVLLRPVSSDILNNQPFPVLFHENRDVSVPAECKTGEYSIALGIYNRHDGRRLKPYTTLNTNDRKVMLPYHIQIVR